MRWILAGVVIVWMILFYVWQNLTVGTEHIFFESDRAEKELTIGLFTDLHAGCWLTSIKKLAKGQNYDLIVLVGDVFDERRIPGANDKMMGLLFELSHLAPCVYVSGNHEYRIRNREALMEAMKETGVLRLENELCTLKIGRQLVTIAGLDTGAGKSGHFHTAAPTQKQICLLRGLSGGAGVRLVLDHYPENFALAGEYAYNAFEFEAMLSGHAHGGQVCLPFIGGLYAPGQGVLPKYTSGMYVGAKHPDGNAKNRLIVSRGVGGRWFLPRVFNRAQIVTIHIRPEKNGENRQKGI